MSAKAGLAASHVDIGGTGMASGTIRLSRQVARWLAVAAQGLARRPSTRTVAKHDLMAAVQRLGCVQLDSISVVSRSHETVLWSRLGPFDPALIGELYDPDHALTEYLTHAAAILPADRLLLFRPSMERARARDGWGQVPVNRAVMDRVVARVREGGPVGSRHFAVPEGAGPAAPWEWHGAKPERQALYHLWRNGELVVRRRDGFQRVFDLPERVAPALWDGPALTEEACRREIARMTIGALGIVTPSWLADYFRTIGQAHISVRTAPAELRTLEAEGVGVPVDVDGVPGPAWLDASKLPLLDKLRAGRGRPTLTTLLSPFDSLVWHRDRALALFDFDYRLESYTPAAKRRYGYYTLPILDRGRIVGRLDPSFDRRAKVLTVKALHLEPGVRVSERLAAAIGRAARELVTFLGGDAADPEAIRWLHAEPGAMLPLLEGGVGGSLRSRGV